MRRLSGFIPPLVSFKEDKGTPLKKEVGIPESKNGFVIGQVFCWPMFKALVEP
jgi:hypothetical protein